MKTMCKNKLYSSGNLKNYLRDRHAGRKEGRHIERETRQTRESERRTSKKKNDKGIDKQPGGRKLRSGEEMRNYEKNVIRNRGNNSKLMNLSRT